MLKFECKYNCKKKLDKDIAIQRNELALLRRMFNDSMQNSLNSLMSDE